MKQLNTELFEQLKRLSGKNSLTRTDPWYDLTYQIFIRQPFDTIDDLWLAIAHAFSWIPRIPAIDQRTILQNAGLIQSLKEWRSGEIHNREEMLNFLVPAINNSLTGTSKTLHFITKGKVPIIDKRVLSGWNSFFCHAGKELGIEKMPTPSTNMSRSHIKNYLYYWDRLDEWSENMNHKYSARDIEKCLFSLGRPKKDEHEQ